MADPKELYYLIEKLCISIAGDKHKKEVCKKATGFLSVCPITLQKFATDVSIALQTHILTQEIPLLCCYSTIFTCSNFNFCLSSDF